MSLSVDVALDHACTRLKRVTLQPLFVYSLRAHTFSARASTRTMFKIEVVIMEPPWDKTIDVWLWHLDTVEQGKQIINDEQTIPKDKSESGHRCCMLALSAVACILALTFPTAAFCTFFSHAG